MYSTVEVLWMIWVLRTRLYLINVYKKKIVWERDARSHVTQDLRDTRLY